MIYSCVTCNPPTEKIPLNIFANVGRKEVKQIDKNIEIINN